MDCVGEMLPFAMRCVASGHAVKLWLAPKNHPDTGKGFKGIERIDNWLSQAKWADIVIPSGNHEFMPKLDMLRKNGVKVFGPTKASAELEIKRGVGMEFFKRHKIDVPEWEQFAGLKEAEAHVKKNPDRYAFKTMGDEEDKSLSYVGKTPADMIARLQRWQRMGMATKGPVMLQKVVDGIEFAVSRWMGSDGFVGPYNENWENKRLLSGDCGPNCGEAGTVLKYVDESKIGDQMLGPLEDALVDMGHTGDVDVNCIVDKQGKAWPLEFTMRLGWPAANIMWSLHKGDPVEWMAAALEGEDTLSTSPQVATGIVLAQPDYPQSNFPRTEVEGIPIYGITAANKKFVSLQSARLEKMPDMEGEEIIEREIPSTTGDYLAVVTGCGKTVKQACERAYSTVKEIHVPNLMYRDDIGEKLEKQIPELQKHGFATEWKYA